MPKRLGARAKDAGMAQSVAQVAAADEHAGAGRYEDIAVEKVIGNERNPRFRAITPDQVRQLREDALAVSGQADDNGPAFFEALADRIDHLELHGSDHLTADDCRARLHTIAGLAQSIRRINLIQPIVVYPMDAGFEVLAGQRRYLAHLLLGRREIRAIVRQPTGDPLQDNLAAVAENLSREELSLRERVEAIEEILTLHEQNGGERLNAPGLQQYLGESTRTCQRYLRILRDSAVREGIRNGEVRSLRQASQMVDGGSDGSSGEASSDRDRRLTSSAPVTHEGNTGSSAGAAAPKRSNSRPKIRVQLGASYRCEEVYRLMSGYLGEDRLAEEYGEVNWADFKDVETAWKNFWVSHIAQDGGDQ